MTPSNQPEESNFNTDQGKDSWTDISKALAIGIWNYRFKEWWNAGGYELVERARLKSKED